MRGYARWPALSTAKEGGVLNVLAYGFTAKLCKAAVCNMHSEGGGYVAGQQKRSVVVVGTFDFVERVLLHIRRPTHAHQRVWVGVSNRP